MNVTRNVMLEPRLTPGGGAVEMALSRFVCPNCPYHTHTLSLHILFLEHSMP